MAPRLKILSNVVKRLKKLNAAVTGHLYGVINEETLTVLTFSINPVDDDDHKIQPIDLQLCMSAEIDLFGILYVDQYKQDIPDAFKDIDVTDNPLLIKYSLDAADINAFYYIHQKLEPIKFDIINEEDLRKNFCYVRLQATLPFISEKTNVLDTLQETRKKLAAGKVSFYFDESNVFLFGNNSDGDAESKSAKELLRTANNKPTPGVIEVVEAGMLLKMYNDKITEEKIKHAPIIQHVKQPVEFYKFSMKIDALSLVGHNVTMAQLYEILVESLCRNLRLIGASFESQLELENTELRLPAPIHFKPVNFGHLLTLVYPVGISASETYEYRKSLHRRLALDMTRPYFRHGNAVKFQNDSKRNKLLLNPHELVANPDGSQISVVNGLYAYYHYMQDGFDDNGWGCAYRSLQTIISWYRLQGYTDKPIPSHKEIQKCLVDIGDKDSTFIGSKQWIGSTEVGFVLEKMLSVSIKVITTNSGDEMPSIVPDLEYHFQTQGTPVMIGGGVLAHTILGISNDKETREVRFLILDPHYTGPEEINIILNRGWCSWKKKDFWRKDAFYNMCLPQRPKCI
ncbi:ufm1-specific protease 2 isoform X2 [Phymastichus coffea]|uniref:ufm1-specific protease 2 isoform X2 n=1 Tax=Phymastichus coffea TaxID=108790 RepID=UPI00273C85D1|nr:ufm1-specific protease 2 isoform X2 [Phymastichus coffea]